MRRDRRLPLALLVPGPLLWLVGVGVVVDRIDVVRIALALGLVAAAGYVVATRIAPVWFARGSSSGSRSSIA